eukprot:2960597-Rhodomonas_salina.1
MVVAGVGILFQADESGALVVTNVIKGGPAFKTGRICEGDILYEVDGVNVCVQSLLPPRSTPAPRFCLIVSVAGINGQHVTLGCGCWGKAAQLRHSVSCETVRQFSSVPQSVFCRMQCALSGTPVCDASFTSIQFFVQQLLLLCTPGL